LVTLNAGGPLGGLVTITAVPENGAHLIVVKQLDAAIATSREHKARVRAPDAELADMKAKRDQVAAQPMRGGAATERALRLLEGATAKLEPPTDIGEARKFLAGVKRRIEPRKLDDDWPADDDERDVDQLKAFYTAEMRRATRAELAAYHGREP
jgi:hypothetical protein